MHIDAHRAWLLVLPVLLLTAFLGAYRMDIAPMWGDEFDSIRDAGGYGEVLESPAAIINRVAAANPQHVPAYFILLNAWAQWVGWETTALRVLAWLVGLLGVAWMYRLGADLLSPRAGLFAAAILGTAALFNDQMQDVRMHGFSGLWIPLVFWLYLRLLQKKKPRWWDWLFMLISIVAMLYTHYFIALPMAALGLYHLLFAPKNRRWWQLIMVMLLAALAFLPWVSVLLTAIRNFSTSARMAAEALPAREVFIRTIDGFSNGVPLLFVVLVLAAAFARGKRAGQVWFFAGVAFVTLIALNEVIDLVLPRRLRYVLPLWPLFALLVSLGLLQLRRYPLAQWGIFLLWLGIGVWSSLDLSFAANQDNNLPERYFRVGLVDRELRGVVTPDDSLVYVVPDGFNPDDTRLLLIWHDNYREPLPLEAFVAARYETAERTFRELRAIMQDAGEQRPRLWLAWMPDRHTSGLRNFQTLLQEQGYGVCEQTANSAALNLALYARSPICCYPDTISPTHRYGDGIALLGARIGDPGNASLPITLAWSIEPSVPPDTYSVTIQLQDAERNVIASADAGLDHFRYLCQPLTLPLTDVPAGEYQLWAGVYHWQTLERLPGTDLTNGGVSDLLHIGHVQIGGES